MRLNALLVIMALLAPVTANAQMSAMPESVQRKLEEIGPGFGKDIRGNELITRELYTPILKDVPRDGIDTRRDVAYGPDERNRLDVFKPTNAAGAPVVVFLHGGAYVAGNRDVNEEVYANVPRYFARNGMIGVNATYRLAPAATWPAAAEDVKLLVSWLRENISEYGGDPNRIYLIGHSAGATHVATYLFDEKIRPSEGAGIAGAVLMSGRYYFDPSPTDPNLKNFQAYFGTDRSRYKDMSPISHVQDAPKIPLFLVISEYDNPGLDTQGAMLLSALCQRDQACPRFTRMDKHNHISMVYQFNTADEEMGNEIMEFIERGK